MSFTFSLAVMKFSRGELGKNLCTENEEIKSIRLDFLLSVSLAHTLFSVFILKSLTFFKSCLAQIRPFVTVFINQLVLKGRYISRFEYEVDINLISPKSVSAKLNKSES